MSDCCLVVSLCCVILVCVPMHVRVEVSFYYLILVVLKCYIVASFEVFVSQFRRILVFDCRRVVSLMHRCDKVSYCSVILES